MHFATQQYAPLAGVRSSGHKNNHHACSKALKVANALPAGGQKYLAHALLMGIQNAVLGNRRCKENVEFCPVKALLLNDETLLIDWIYPQGRVSFYIDADAEESSIVYLDGLVDNGGLPNVVDDELVADRIDEIAMESVEFVSRFASYLS